MRRTVFNGRRPPFDWLHVVIGLLGLIAGVLTTGCWLPQVVRSVRTRRMDDFSWTYLGLLGAGIMLWMLYGVIRKDPIIVGSNGITLILLLVLMFLKVQDVP